MSKKMIRGLLLSLALVAVFSFAGGEIGRSAEAAAETTGTDVNPMFSAPPSVQGHDDEWAFEPTDIFGFFMDWHENADLLKRAHISVFCPGFYNYSEQTRAADENTVQELADMGIRMADWLSTFDLQEEPVGELEYVADALCEDIDGNSIIFGLMGWPMQCTNNPKWQQYLTDAAVYVAELDSCGTAADEWLGTAYTLGNHGCFCEYCMAGFREYLKEKYTTQELLDMGIGDIDTFDYGDYIRENCYELYLEDEYSTPYFADFRMYQLHSIVDFYTGVNEKIKQTAAASNSDGYFSANMASLMTDYFAIAGVVDYMAPEVNYAYPPDNITTVLYRIAASMDKPLYGAPNCYENTEMMLDEGVCEIMKIYTAQAYANQGFIMVPYHFNAFLEWEGNVSTWVHPDLEPLYPFYNFIDANSILFDGLISQADIGILYSYASEVHYTGSSRDTVMAVGECLLDAGYNFDIVFTGDYDLIHDTFTLETLNQYELIIMPAVCAMNDEEEQMILAYIKGGGKVLSIDETATRYADDSPRTETSPLNAEETMQLSMGDGIYAHIDDIRFDYGSEGGYASMADGEVATLLAVLDGLYSKPLIWDNEETVDITKYFSTRVNGYVMHAVNYAYNSEAKQVIALTDVGISMVNDTPFSGDTLGVCYITPETAEYQALDFVLEDGWIRFTLPTISAWGTIVVGEDARIEAMMCIDSAEASLRAAYGEAPEASRQLLDEAMEALLNSDYELAISLSSEAMTLPAKTEADNAIAAAEAIVALRKAKDLDFEDVETLLNGALTSFETGDYEGARQLAAQLIAQYDLCIVDGELDDWAGVQPAAEDPMGDAAMPGCDLGNVYVKTIGDTLYLAIQADTENPFIRIVIWFGDRSMNINCQGDPVEIFFFTDNERIDPLPDGLTACLGEAMECAIPLSVFDGETELTISIDSFQNNYPEFDASDAIEESIEIALE